MKPSSIYIYIPPLIPLLLLSLERFAGELSVVLKVDTLHHYCTDIFPSFVITIIFIIIIIIVIIILHSNCSVSLK